MGGLAVLGFIGLYVFIAYKSVKFAKPAWAKGIVLMVVLLIPTADAIYGRIKLKQMCAAESGLKVNRVAEHVAGFMEAFKTIDDDWVKNGGYQFSESAPVNGLVTRYSRQNGQIIKEEKVIPKSQYRIRFENVGQKDVYGRSIDLVETVDDKEVLATYTAIAFKGGWAERFLAHFSDAGVGNVAFCGGSPQPAWNVRRELITNSLKP